MAHPLDGANFKIIWAHQHVAELERHIATYLNVTAYRTVAYRHGDITIVNAPTLVAAPHLDIQGIIGDGLCAVMASLDYIIWELASIHAGRPLSPPHLGGSDMPSFPLYNSKKRYDAASKPKQLRTEYHFPTDVMNEIAAVQPHNAGYQPLWLLYVLVNQDKHRLPLLVEGHISAGTASLEFGGEFASIAGAGDDATTFNTPVSIMPYDRTHEMHVDAQIVSKFVAFGDPAMKWKPVEILLHDIVVCAGKVVGQFHRFFV